MAGKKIQAQLTPEEKLQQALVPEAEQPYKVPTNWCWTKLGKVTNVIMGQSPNGGSITENEKDTPLIGGAADMGEKYPEIKRYTNKPTKISSDEDLIICVRATLGKPIFSDGRYCLGRGVAAIRPLVGSRELYKYFFLNFEQYLFDNATGTTFTQVNSNILQKMPLPLPPLAEQKRIVERIESLFTKLDEAKENLQNVLDSFETRKAAILHKAFTGELIANWRKQHGVSMESWESVKVSNLCENIVCGKTPTSYIDNNGDIPYLKVYNIVNNKIDFDSKPQYIPKKIHESKLKSSILKPKDVIMNIVGPPLRKIAIIPDTYPEWNMNQAIVRFRTKEKLYYKYLYYYLIYPKTLDDIICETKGVVGQANISITQSRNLNINLPTFSEQTEIVRIIDELFVKEQQAKELAENALAKIEIIKKAILARAFCGELGTNNPADEPAVELLKRVL